MPQIALADVFLESYHERVNQLHWRVDQNQQEILEKIAVIYHNHDQQCSRFSFAWLWGEKTSTGIYLHGSVGRGKTALMDIVANTLPSPRKKRWHFTEFTQTIYELNARFAGNKDRKVQPIEQTILYLKKQYDYLFLDELEVTEIADAMLLGRLFKGLTQAGILIFLTSNTAPKNLYKGGLHYDRFYPFIAYISDTFELLRLDNQDEIDFRTLNRVDRQDFPDLATLQNRFTQFLEKEGHHPAKIMVNQRTLEFPFASKTAIWLDFGTLGENAYGAVDYQFITQNYQYVFLVNVPQFNELNSNAARRFITLIDCLYDNKVTLFFHADSALDELFRADIKTPLPFQRTLSRLLELCKVERIEV